MTGSSGWAAAGLGLALGVGAALIALWAWARRPTLAARIAPHVRATLHYEIARRATPVTPFPTLERIVAPVVRDGVRMLERWGSPSADIERRLRRGGRSLTADQFRAQQVAWGLAGLVAGVLLSSLLAASRGPALALLLVITVSCAAAAIAARDLWLTRAIRRRERRILEELPPVAELLALSVAAGEGPLAALERVARTTSGVLADEMRGVLAAARAGERVPDALAAMADAVGVPALQRFADGVVTAVERGTPLADVLRAQAADARAHGRRLLVEEGGRREIAMMVPVVFLILPVTVLFAILPGIMMIDLGGR